MVAAVLAAGLAHPRIASAQAAVIPVRELLRDVPALVTWLADHSLDATAAAARVDQAQAAYGSSRLRPNPQLGLGLAGIPVGTTNPAGLGFSQTVNYGATVSELFELGKRGPRSAAARLRLESERHTLTDMLGNTLAGAREAMARVLYLKSRQATIQEQLDISRQIVELQRTRFDRGDLSGIDFDRVQLDAEVLQADLSQAASDYRQGLAACASVLFASCDTGDAGLETLVDLIQPPDATLPADWEARLRERPDIRALGAQQEATAQDVVLALRRKVPDPVVSFGYTRDYFLVSGNNPRVVSTAVTIPLPTFDRGKQDAARALAEGTEVQATAAAMLSRARADALSLRDRQTLLLSALDRLRGDALARATGILTGTTEAVSQGELSTTDLLLARRARTDVLLRIMDLQLQLFLTQNELRQVLGLDIPIVQSIQGVKWPTP